MALLATPPAIAYGDYVYDRMGSSFLDTSAEIDQETTEIRSQVKQSLQSKFQVSEPTHLYKNRVPVNAVSTNKLPEIIGNSPAQAASQMCQTVNKRCVNLIKERCLTYEESDGLLDYYPKHYKNIWNHREIRTCSVKHNSCEKLLSQCVEQDVIPLSSPIKN